MTLPDNSNSKLSQLFKKAICLLVGYFDGQVNRFTLNSEGELCLSAVTAKDKSPLILIASRHCYQEVARTYPIENTKELKKLLALELDSQQNSYYHICGKDNGQSQVNQWVFQTKLPKAIFTLPESLLFALSAKNNQVTHIQTAKASFVTRANGLVHSVPQSKLIATDQHFTMSVGVNSQLDNKVIDEDNFVNSLAQAIKHFPVKLLTRFINLPQTKNNPLLLKQLLTPVVVVLTAYLLLTSAYLSYKQSDLQQKIAAQSKDVTNALDVQQALEQKNSRYIALKAFFAEQQTSSDLWLTLVNIFPQAIIHNIRKIEDRYVIRGMTDSATSLLELVSQQVNVVDAKFDLPIRKNRNKETFIISFKVNSKGSEQLKVDSLTRSNN